MKIPEDNRNTTEWAIAPQAGVSAIVSGQLFMLANRVTGRAHDLYFLGGGLTFGIDVDVSKNLDYTSFRTKRPVNFNDFHGKAARVTAIHASAGLGYARTVLTIGKGIILHLCVGENHLGRFGIGKLGLKGQAAVHGVFAIKYGNGDPHGLIAREIDPALFPDPVSFTPATPHLRVRAIGTPADRVS